MHLTSRTKFYMEVDRRRNHDRIPRCNLGVELSITLSTEYGIQRWIKQFDDSGFIPELRDPIFESWYCSF